MTQQDAPHEQTEQDLQRAKRRSCIFRLLMVWFAIGATIIVAMIYTRGQVERDPAKIETELSKTWDIQLPSGFYAYSLNDFFGVTLAVFYHEEHVRNDGRTTSVISIHRDHRWRDQSLEETRDDFLADLPDRLNKREFKVKEERVETRTVDGETLQFHVFIGVQLMDENFVDAVTTYRFIQGPDGPVQIHAMGLAQTFPTTDQIEALSGFRLKP